MPELETFELAVVRGNCRLGMIGSVLQGLAKGATQQLTEITLPWAGMKANDFHAFADCLEAREKLGCQALVMNPIQIGGIDLPVEALKRVIRCCLPTILKLSTRFIGEVYAECLATTQAPALKVLFSGRADPGVCTSISKALADGHMPALEVLDFNTSDLHGEAMAWFSQAIEKGRCPRLQALNLSGANLDAEDIKQLMKAMIESRSVICLKTLDLNRNAFGDVGMVHLAKAIELGAFDNLESISVGSCHVGNEGLAALSHAWKRRPSCSPKLTKLRLNHNAVRHKGVKTFAGALMAGALPHLQVLSFSSNTNLGDDGLTALAQAFSRGAGKDLLSLDAIECNIGGVGVKALINPIKRGACAKLNRLLVDCERLDAKVVGAFIGVLAAGACPDLQHLWLSRSIAMELKDALNAVLRVFDGEVSIH